MNMRKMVVIMGGIIFLLVACSSNEPVTEEVLSTLVPTLDQQALADAVEATVSAELTRIALENPSPTPTSAPTDTPPPPESTTAPTDVPLPSPTISDLALDNQALFLADVSIPDGTEIIAGEAFTKTWRLQNIGVNTWTEEYSFVFVNGELMDGFPVFLEGEIEPGEIIEFSIPMIAPSTAGIYEGYWMLADPEGIIFGVGENADFAVLVSIVVIEPTPEPTETPTPEATSTP